LLVAIFNFIDVLFVADKGGICLPHFASTSISTQRNEIVLPFTRNLQYLSPISFCRRVCEFIYLNFILRLPFSPLTHSKLF